MSGTFNKAGRVLILALIFTAAGMATLCPCARGQTTPSPGAEPVPVSGGTVKPAPQLPEGVVDLSRVFDQADEAERRAAELLKPFSGPEEAVPDPDELGTRIKTAHDQSLKDSARNLLNAGELEQQLAQWQRELQADDKLSAALGDKVAAIQSAQAELSEAVAKWQATANAYEQAGFTGPPLERTQGVLTALATKKTELDARLAPVLAAQERLSRSRALILDHLDFLTDMKRSALEKPWQKDRPALYESGFFSALAKMTGDEFQKSWKALYTDTREYLLDVRDRLALELLFLLGLWLWLRTLLPRIKKASSSLPSQDELQAVFSHPFSISLLLVSMAVPFLHPEAPLLTRELFLLIMVFPVVLILVRLIAETNLKYFIVGIGISHVIGLAREILASAPPLDRLALIVQVGFGIGVTVFALAPQRLHAVARDRGWERSLYWIRLAQWILLGLLGLSLLGQVFGFHRLSVFLGTGAFRTTYLTLLLVATYRLLRSFLVYFLFSRQAQRIRSVQGRELEILGPAGRLLALGFFLAWAYLVLRTWDTAASALSLLAELWQAGFSLGQTRFSLGILVGSGLALYLSFKVSRVINFLLDQEVFSRRPLEGGLGDAIKQGVRYVVGFIGLVVALSILGVSLQSLAIVAGALGVGIGFGLQNVVNNFVAGIILLVERPIKVGDVLAIDGQWGVVRRIGIRSTLLEVWDQSEMIMPNGDLLWSKLVNWTHTSGRNWIVIPIGTAYGSDPAKVIEVLLRVAAEHPEVMKDPGPRVFFQGFGESALEFELRCFLPAMDRRLPVSSELRVAIFNAFAEEGIEIPFPQRDVYIKSMPPTGA